MGTLLDNFEGPETLAQMTPEQLEQLAEELRQLITHSVSRTGGHLASNLGIVELTIAMHCAFDFRKDRLLWDVGHQCYTHKILSGRRDLFHKLRQESGLSGFPNPAESVCDVFSVGHAGTSIATALGMALGAEQTKTDEKIVALVGDASIVNGLSFEALNNVGLVKRQMLVILNDNSMAIDVTQGATAKFLSRVRLSHTYEDLRNTTNHILERVPLLGKRMEEALDNVKKTLRMANSPSRLFESLNIAYFGPVDGHDIVSLTKIFKTLGALNRPVILHVYTRKGKGYSPADDNPRKYHSTGPFQVNGSSESEAKEDNSYTRIFGEALTELGEKDSRVMAITAAMPDGTGLAAFREKLKDRCFDVGIAESVAIDIAAGLARRGLRPFVCIYSTFLQRGFDQIFQEVSLQNLPVVFCVDRAGVVGSDGPTHHGMLDIGYLRMLPNMAIAAPADAFELKQALALAVESCMPFAVRYPRDTVPQIAGNTAAYAFGRSVMLRQGASDYVIVALGPIVAEALKAAGLLQEQGVSISVINARFAKPVDPAITALFAEGKTVIVAEDHSRTAGFGSAVIEEALAAASRTNDAVLRAAIGKAVLIGGPDSFIPAAKRTRQLEWMGLTAEKLAQTILDLDRTPGRSEKFRAGCGDPEKAR